MPSSAKVRPCAWAVASWKYRLLAAWAFVACAEASEPPATGPLLELPLLAPIDPTKPFNHSAEATLVANGGHVAVAATQLHLDSETSFGTTNLLRKVAVIASHDRGERRDHGHFAQKVGRAEARLRVEVQLRRGNGHVSAVRHQGGFGAVVEGFRWVDRREQRKLEERTGCGRLARLRAGDECPGGEQAVFPRCDRPRAWSNLGA